MELIAEYYMDALAGTNEMPGGANMVDGDDTTYTTNSSGNNAYSKYDQVVSAVTWASFPLAGNTFVGEQRVVARVDRALPTTGGNAATGTLYIRPFGSGTWTQVGDSALVTGVRIIIGTFLAEDIAGFAGIEQVGLACSQGGGNPNSRESIRIASFKVTARYEVQGEFKVNVWDEDTQQYVSAVAKRFNYRTRQWEQFIAYRYSAADGWVVLL